MTGAPELRPYQLATVQRIAEAVEAGHRRILAVVPTGGGKTIIAAHIVQKRAAAGDGVLFLAHRRELIFQTAMKLHSVGVDHGIVLAGHPTRPGERVQVAMIPTLHARAVRGSRMELPAARLVIVDEAQHIRAETYMQILAAYPEAIILGLTATPCRGDGRGLGNAFEILVEGPSVAELTRDGFLVPAKVYAPSSPDLAGVKVRHGDYVEGQLAERMDKAELVGDIVEHWLRLAPGRPTVVFATGVAHSQHICDRFAESGIVFEHIDGETPPAIRDATLRKLAEGKIDGVSNAMVLTEGWDAPAVSCLVLARPTKSLGLYRQMAGRVLRPSPGKSDCLVLDHSGATYQHGFVDDDIEWTLREDKRAENKSAKKRQSSSGGGKPATLTNCPECKAVRWEGEPCGACGWRPQRKPQNVEVLDGDLVEIDRRRRAKAAADEGERRKFFAELLWIADERGYKPGWAAHKYQEKFGAWPVRGNIEPRRPEFATRQWVKSRAIAWAKSQQRGAA